MAVDIEHLRGWIGSSEEASEQVTPVLLDRFVATLGRHLWQGDDGAVPLGLHWCLTLPLAAADTLGPDGHPPRGGFLPPVPLASRMWAGGEVRFLQPLRLGDMVTRRSTVADVVLKSGSASDLVFVTVDHRFLVGGREVVAETQNIVYRDSTPPKAGAPAPGSEAGEADCLTPGPVLLFRYSALTFNGHRIHYDAPYARDVEGYPGLVVHGPLQATLLINLAARLLGAPPPHFSYRGLAPLIAGRPVTLHHRADGDAGELWCRNADGARTMQVQYGR